MSLQRSLGVIAVLAIFATSALSAAEHPLEVYVRAASGNLYEPISEADVIKAYGVETNPNTAASVMHRRIAPHLMTWYQQQLSAYPILTTHPEQIHLSVTEYAGNVSVLWTTSNASTTSEVCYYAAFGGGSPSSERCVNGSSWTYFPISVVPWYGSLHGAHMTGLIPGQSYCYRVGDPILNVFTPNYTCFTAPELTKDSITVALGGDMGSVQLFGYLVADRMRSDEASQNIAYDAFWLLGDIAYSTLDPGPRSPNGEFFWDIFMRQEESFVNHIPMLVTYGNHDFDAGDSGAFINRFRNPQGGNAGVGNFYWSYTHGPVKFVSMCTEVDLVPSICNYAPGSDQYRWLEAQFASVNRTETPWLILGGHRPMYSSDLSTDSGPLQQYIEPLLRQYNVDVQISGHMHDTELVSPVFNNTPYLSGVAETGLYQWTVTNAQAPLHITAGSLGAVQDEKYPKSEYPWSLFHSGTILDDAYGYVRLDANRTSLHFTFVKQSDGIPMWELMMNKN